MRNVFFLLVAVLTISFYQNCSGVHEDSGAAIFGSESGVAFEDVDRAKSLVAFEKTLFPITQEAGSCVECHEVDQQPLHSTKDMNFAHDVMLSFGLVNLRDVPNSKLLDTLRNRNIGAHNNNLADRNAIADRMEAAIQEWSDELVANGGLIGAGEGVQPTYASLFAEVFDPKCVSCHSADGEAPDIDYSNYVNTINLGQVIPGNGGASGVYIHTNSGQEPRGGDAELTAEQLSALRLWIDRGALNN